jgi:protein-S-isoprenylcysteine O-methyltransferase Ste14
MLEWLAFFIGTAFLYLVSRAALRLPKSHGFYRFFAWELMLILIVLNMDGWYSAPFNLDQTVSGILMGLSLILVIASYESLRRFGKQDNSRNDTHLLQFEKTTELVTAGIYRHIRHPMYSSLILLDWGLFFKQAVWLNGSIALAACIFLVFAALAEEQENIRFFGAPYREYMKLTDRFLPYIV